MKYEHSNDEQKIKLRTNKSIKNASKIQVKSSI